MRFTLHCSDGSSTRLFYYDNETSVLTDDTGKRIADPSAQVYSDFRPVHHTSAETPGNKVAAIKTLKIQLGLACNYSCQYCSQNDHRAASVDGHPRDVEVFMRNLDTWLVGVPRRVEFWGGEPFAYWKTLKPLAEAMRAKYPKASLLIITNGSLLNEEINQWICDLDIDVGVSHDGPGQHVRGPDPLDDPEQRKWILDLFRRRQPLGKISFNTVINRENMDRAKVQEWFRKLLGRRLYIGEGQFVDPYDAGSAALSLHTHEEALSFRNLTLRQIRRNQIPDFAIMRRIAEWIASISSARPSGCVGQKCGMDRSDTIAVDLKGNVLTCQNVSVTNKAPNGRSHHLGHVSALGRVKLTTATHWAHRKECTECPLVQMCKGSCMYLQGPLWVKACNNAYNDHLPFFAVAIERLTGYLPYKIEAAALPPERSALWE